MAQIPFHNAEKTFRQVIGTRNIEYAGFRKVEQKLKNKCASFGRLHPKTRVKDRDFFNFSLTVDGVMHIRQLVIHRKHSIGIELRKHGLNYLAVYLYHEGNTQNFLSQPIKILACSIP